MPNLNETSRLILSEVSEVCMLDSSRQTDLVGRLERLEPTQTENLEPNFLSFNVGDKRMKTKVGRFLASKLELNHGFLTDVQLQAIATAINLKLFGTDVILCSGAQITENYRKEVGGNSCMTGADCESTLLYEMNPDRFSQAVLYSGNDSARAIVSKLDCGQRYQDRIYTTCDTLRDRLIDYAIKNGWHYRNRQGYVYFGGNEIENALKCKILKISGLTYEDNAVPYMDTFKDYKIRHGKLDIGYSLSNSDGELSRTDGRLEEEMSSCCDCGGRVHNNDRYASPSGETLCENCYNDNYASCDKCGETFDNDDCQYYDSLKQTLCKYCLEGNYTQCDKCNEWLDSDDVFEFNGENYCEDCHSEVCAPCDDCLEDTAKDDLTKTDDNTNLCADCFEKYETAEAESQAQNV